MICSMSSMLIFINIHLVFLKMSVIGNIVFTRFLMSELIIELSRLRFNSNVRTETVADNILQEANHRFEKVFQIILSDSFSAEILQNSIHSICMSGLLFINNGIRRIKGLRSRSQLILSGHSDSIMSYLNMQRIAGAALQRSNSWITSYVLIKMNRRHQHNVR